MKFTEKGLLNLKPRTERYEVWETNDHGKGNLGVRVFPSGQRSWVFMYKFQGKARRMTLGQYPAMSVAEAHKRHAEAVQALEDGRDPGAAHVEARQAERVAPTVAQLGKEYLEKWAKPRKRSWAKDDEMLRRDVLPALGHLKAKDVRRRDVLRLLDGIVARGAPIRANRTLALLRKMFNFAISRDIVEHSPCVAVKPPAPENRKDRTLTEDEIRTFWRILDSFEPLAGNEVQQLAMTDRMRLALKLQLVTAQRIGEVIGLPWDEIDGNWWTIPAGRTKNKLTHRVPLSPLALEILEQARALSGSSLYAFPSPRGDRPMCESAASQAVRDNLTVFGIAPFTPHDLRRTAASHMTGISVSRLVVSKILNHAEKGITAVYDRHSYDAEKRQALDTWARKLRALIKDSNGADVVPLTRAG